MALEGLECLLLEDNPLASAVGSFSLDDTFFLKGINVSHHCTTVDVKDACNFAGCDGGFSAHQLDDALLVLLSTFLSTVV